MDREIVERAIARAASLRQENGALGVGHEILVHLDAEMSDPADRVLVEQPGDVADRRTLDVVVAEDRDPAAGARRRRHALRVRERGRHRLFAPDVLAGLERGDRHRGVQAGRGGDRDDIDLRVCDERLPVGGRGLETERVGAAAGEPLLDLAERDAPDRGPVAEHRPHRAQASAWHLPM